MRLFVMILTILVFSGLVSAECREKSCMTNEFKFDSTGHKFYYNEVFDIGTNWYIIFDYPENNNNNSIEFTFVDGPSKVYTYNEDEVTDSVSFSGSSFSDEKFNTVLNIKVNGNNTNVEFNLSIDVNKPPADDLFYLWGGMTVFWFSIGAYVLYISTKFTQLRER
tara:strand:+ start:180 stop:674 length:495 start_codon:yes stop_codon:yes gene_type:complete